MLQVPLRSMEAPLTLDQLKTAVRQGAVDTVLLALTDMEGRLQGKRLTGEHFVEVVADHGAEACNYLLAVAVEVNTVGGYTISSWERACGAFEMNPALARPLPVPWQEATAFCMADLQWADGSPVAE